MLGEQKCEQERLLDYALYLDSSSLRKLKAEALNFTRHMKLSKSELSRLYIGYRQLTALELDQYDNFHPPPIPYPFTDQINSTVRVSASTPSCLYLNPGDDRWQTSGCKVSFSLTLNAFLLPF